VQVLDANGARVGSFVDMQGMSTARVLTSTGYLVTIGRNGSGDPTPIYYTTTTCTGTPYVEPYFVGWAKNAFFDPFANRLLEVAGGAQVSVTYASVSYSAGHCAGAFSGSAEMGLALRAVTPSVVGIAGAQGVPGPVRLSTS
jgi:hypothetical protein